MKIDRSKIKKGTAEVPAECKILIEKLKSCGTDRKEVLNQLKLIKTWSYGKCELYHWADVLDVFDEILENACKHEVKGQWVLPCDLPGHEEEKQLLLQVLHFTSLLIEHSFTRHLYNSMEYLTEFMSSSDMTVVLGVLNLLYVFSKRSNFITRLSIDKKQALVVRLTHLAESWGGKENGFGLAECCQQLSISSFPSSATTLHFEFYAEQVDEKSNKKNTTTVLSCIHVDNMDKNDKLGGQLMDELLSTYSVPEDKKILLFTHIRLAQSFSSYEKRMQCVHARLLAISILVYSNAMQENVNTLLYNGFVEELVDILELKDSNLVEIKAAALRTLTSVIHLDRNPKLQSIIDATGASSYHGFLPVLVRSCIQHMTDVNLDPFPQPFATSLFSFLYHLASYESGGEALVSCGMMESLLRVVNWFGEGQEHITFVTRAVRVVDLITNLDMQAFQTHTGLNSFINRLEHEVNICRKDQPFEIRPKHSESHTGMDSNPSSPAIQLESSSSPGAPMDTDTGQLADGPSTSTGSGLVLTEPVKLPNGKNPQCFPQRAALLKSMLNFLKKAIPDPSFSDSIRHLMDASLPSSLKHIISNAEYYGPSLFLLATDVVTVYVYQEPSLLSSLQDNGLTDVVLHALLVKDVPATREVLSSLPNVFSALCLNARGLESFVQCKPFDRLFKVLLSPDYLPAMRRRRSSDPPGDTASSLGSAMDELMRHQPSLKTEATKAIIKLLEEVCTMGKDPSFICQKPQAKHEPPNRISVSMSNIGNEGGSSDEDEEDEEVGVAGGTSKDGQLEGQSTSDQEKVEEPHSPEERKPIPLMDYVLNVMKFVEAILSNNTTDDHCREFITQKGLEPLMTIFGLPNLPVEFPTSPSCQAVSSVCKSVLTLAHESSLLKEGLKHLNQVLGSLDTFYKFLEPPGGSILIKEFVAAQGESEPTLSCKATPLLHGLSQAHAYVAMFTHVCKVGQTDIRSMSVNHWGSPEGLQALSGLSKLYTSLVWESTILLSFCSEDTLPADCDFGKKDIEKLLPKESNTDGLKDKKSTEEKGLVRSSEELGSNGVSAAMESLSTHDSPGGVPMETDNSKIADSQGKDSTVKLLEGENKKLSPQMQAQLKQIKPLLNVTSRLGKALAELFGLLVKLSVGSPVRQRRTQISTSPSNPSPAAKAVAQAISKLLSCGLKWEPPVWSPIPKLRLTFYICSVGFISPMLFDDKKYPYHLMLQKFVGCGGQDAMFDTFRWALTAGGQVPPSEGLEYEHLPDGTGEFLDAWLLLMERMVNVKNVLESPHMLPTKPVTFNPLQFLICTHKLAFETVMYLWDKKPLKTYGRWMSESILAILCHIIKGESVIKEKLEKEMKDKAAVTKTEKPTAGESSAEGATSSGGLSLAGTSAGSGFSARTQPPPPRQEPEVNQDHLQQLMDMGFTREHATDALRHTTSLEQATDYILTHPPPPPVSALGSRSSAMQQVLSSMDLGSGSDEEQMLRAIAISLGEALGGEPTQTKPEEKKKEPEPPEPVEETQKEETPLEKDVLDQFTESMFSGCMKLLDSIPESVYRVCEIMSVVTTRNGDQWREDSLRTLCEEVADLCLKLLQAAKPLTTSDSKSVVQWSSEMASMEEASKLAARLHLLTLLLEEMKIHCAKVVDESGILEILVRLLEHGLICITAAKETATPKWTAPLVLLLDLYEKMAVGSKRRSDLGKIVGKVHVWKWFDDRSGKWCNYSNSNNKTIDDAYVAGDSSIRFTAGRRRYTVQFGTMVQVNEETGNRRPIMLSLPVKEESSSTAVNTVQTSSDTIPTGTPLELSTPATPNTDPPKEPTSKEVPEESKMELEEVKEESKVSEHSIKGLMPDQIGSVIRSSVGLIGKPADPETLHAVMRLVLRLTREHTFAKQFAELGGTKLLLALKQNSEFQGFTSLTTLIFRHVLEEPITLRQTIEKVIRTATSGTGSSAAGVASGSIGSRELNYVLRVLSPAACRDPLLFTEVAKSSLRIALPPPAKRDEDETRLTSANTAQVLKCLPSKQTTSSVIEGHAKTMLHDILNALTHTYTKEEEAKVTDVKNLAEAIQEVIQDVTQEVTERSRMVRQNSTADLQDMQRTNSSDIEGNMPSNEVQSNGEPSTTSNDGKEGETAKEKVTPAKSAEEIKKERPLLPKSSLLRLLAEMVRSYAGCAHTVTHHIYESGLSESITEDCSALAFILDNLLPQCQAAGDKDCPALSKVLIASIAAANHSPEAQGSLVTEIKLALQRALVLPESSHKHSKVQALTGLVSTVIESCPVPGQVQNQVFKGQQNSMNNMVKLLLKKGLVTDLARIPHSLDLSSPNMANTMNAALRPLETLSRIVNQPQTIVSSSKGSKSKTTQEQELDSTVVFPSGTDSTVIYPSATGNAENVRDTNTESAANADPQGEAVSRQQSNTSEIVPSMESQQGNENELQDVIDELLNSGPRNNPEDDVLGEIIMESTERHRQQHRHEDRDLPMIMGVEVGQEEEEDDDDNHDSQMVTQEISDVEDDTDDQAHDHIDEGGSDADVDHDEDDHDANTDEEDDDDDDEDEEEHDEDEDEEGSDMEGDEDDYGDDTYYLGGGDDDLYVQLEDMLPDTGLVMDNAMAGASLRNYHIPIAMHDNDNGNDPAGPSVPPAPSNVTANHPLLVRQADTHGIANSFTGRLRGIARNRGAYRYNPSTQTLHVQYVHDQSRNTGRSGQMNLLQNLLGQNLTANMIQLSSGMATQPTRFTFISQNDNRMEEDPFEDMFQDPFYDGDGGNSGVLSNVPPALTRWTEEAKVLDGDTVHDCVTLLKPEIISELEGHRDKELAERKEKRKKQAEEDAAKKAKEEAKKGTGSKKESSEKSENGGNAEGSKLGEGFDDKDGEEDKTIEWGTPPEVLPLPQSSTANSSDASMMTPTGPSSTNLGNASENIGTDSQPPSIIQAGDITADSQMSIPETEQAFIASNSSSMMVSATDDSIADQSSIPTSRDVLETPAQSNFITTPAAPLVQRNFAGALGLGFSDTPASSSPCIRPPSPTPSTPMDIEQSLSSALGLSTVPPPSIPDREPLLADVSEIPLPPLTGQPVDGSLSQAVLDLASAQQQGIINLAANVQESSTIGAGTITPPIPSDITSSDNVTVNSSPISTEPNSVTDTDTQSSEQPPVLRIEAITPPATSVATSVTSSTAATSTSAAPSSSTNRTSGDSLPDGVDPSFLAALPDSIRQEVIAEQLRLERIQQRAQEQQQQAAQLGVGEVNPEFLAALPPNIQEEVLAQQRAEQSRVAPESTPVDNPEAAVDPASFIASLPSGLRQQVLADMDDSMVAVLPPDLASEANNLRRELEDRHRRVMQERLFNQGSGPLSALLRHTGLSGRIGGSRYMLRPPSRVGDHWLFGRPRTSHGTTTSANTVKLRGRHLLDHEALACLLVMLFVDEPRLNSGRLHRVLRNLCYHAPTRSWVIKALLSILHRTGDCKSPDLHEDNSVRSGSLKTNSDKLKKKTSGNTNQSSGLTPSGSSSSMSSGVTTNLLDTPSRSGSDLRAGQPPWLSISLDAALGCRANVFQVHRSHGGKKTASGLGTSVDIHPQASPVVCRHVLDALISLAKSFPNQFLPQNKAKEVICGDGATPTNVGAGAKSDKMDNENRDSNDISSKPSSVQTSPSKSVSKTDLKTQETDFWELLLKLDHQSVGRKGKGMVKYHSNTASGEDNVSISFESSPMGLLMSMLAHNVIRRSQLLTDRLLRLLGLVSVGLPDITQQSSASSTTATTSTATTSAPTSTSSTTYTVAATSLISSTLGPNVPQDNQSTVTSSDAARSDETLPLNETMDISAMPDEHLQTSTPLPGKKEEKQEEKTPVVQEVDKKQEQPVLQNQLQLAVQVLTSKSCSEEGLEDATNLLLQLSRANGATRESVLYLLLAGARDLGMTVCTHIRQLLSELKDLTLPVESSATNDEEMEDSSTPPQKDSPVDRYSGVVITAPNKVKKSGKELQLPAMNLLTSKISSQQFLLRILKVIIQLRDAAKAAAKKKKKPERDFSSISEAMSMLEAEAETIMELVQQRERQLASVAAAVSGNSTAQPAPLASSSQPATAQAGTSTATGQSALASDAPMDVDQPGSSASSLITPLEVDTRDKPSTSSAAPPKEEVSPLPRLSELLLLEELWEILGDCLTELAKTPDLHAVLVLQPAVEAFFLVHAGEKDEKKKDSGQQKREDQLAHLNADITAPMSPAPHQGVDSMSSTSVLSRQDSVMSSSVISVNLPPDTQKFLRFAETHRTVLNQILRQSTSHLADGPFSVLVDHTRILDFDVKRRYFRQELDRMDEGRGMRREDIAVHVKREHVFEDSFRELLRKTKEDWKQRFYIVFEGEEGQDAGGLIREWYLIMSREIFNPNYVLFKTSPGDRVTYTMNPSSHYNSNHLSYFKFVGRFLAKAIYDNKLLDCFFTRSFYKHILGKPVKYTDMESEDYSFYQGLVFLLENNVSDIGYELTFSTDIQEFGVTSQRELKSNGRNVQVTEENKREYVKLVCQERMTGAIRQQLNAFLEGFYEIIPKRLISIFNEQELELLMSGLPTIDIDDLKSNTEYHKYQTNSLQIQWFWRALRSFDQTDRAAFLQFVTGTSKVPLQGFAHLEGMNGAQKFQIHRDDRSTDRLPSAHTCFNQLDLPAYETYTKLRSMLLLAFHECSEGFGLA